MENELIRLADYLKDIDYPGRGIMVGLTKHADMAMYAYFIMGRSENSRNRLFRRNGSGIRTEAADPSKMTDPSLIIYNAVRVLGKKTIITNGDQTDTIYDTLEKGGTFEQALDTRTFEPDKPNYTPRISALVDFTDGFNCKMGILRSKDQKGEECRRDYYDLTPEPGVAYVIHTYDHDGDPLPSFTGGPRRTKLTDIDIHGISKTLWNNLNEQNKISVFIRCVDLKTGRIDSAVYNVNFDDKAEREKED